MEVILLERINKLGNLGDKVSVRPGFARNFLIPYGKALPATKANLEVFEQRRAEYEAAATERLSAAEKRQAKLQDCTVSITANASGEGKLFGSVGPREIAEALTASVVEVEKSEVILGQGPIRLVGIHEVIIHVHADIDVTVNVEVIGEEPVTV